MLSHLLSRGSSIYQRGCKFFNNVNVARLVVRPASSKTRLTQSRLKRSGYLLFAAIDDQIDFPSMIRRFNLDDSYFSYYLICELHVWMIMARLSQDGKEGKLVKQSLCEAMWEIIDKKSKNMGKGDTSGKPNLKKDLASMGEHFNAAMFNYDEGILGDDRSLAAAVWRSFYSMRDVSPSELSETVQYIRLHMRLLDEADSDVLLGTGAVNFNVPYGE